MPELLPRDERVWGLRETRSLRTTQLRDARPLPYFIGEETRLSKPKPHAQSHRASQCQSLARIQDSSHCSAVHSLSTQCWGAVFIQVDSGGGAW